MQNTNNNKNHSVIRSIGDLGHVLEQYRLEQGLSQSELARKISKHQTVVSRLETGEKSAVLRNIFAILRTLNLEIQVLPRRRGSAKDIEDMFP